MDTEKVEKARNGNVDEIGSLLMENMKSMYRVAFSILKTEEEISDAISNTTVIVFEKIHTLKNAEFFKTWLIRILINECNKIHRQNKKIIYLENYNQTDLVYNDKYDDSYNYIHELFNVGVPKADIYKTLINFDVKVINEKGNQLSGGERAEYNLLREIKGSEQYDILLLDEPEASFDNPFIKDYIIDIIKDISQKTTVFITTHNNSLGVLINPNKLIYTSNDEDEFKVYTGEFGSKNLTTVNGDSIISYDTIMEVMEAGTDAYDERRQIYESFKN